MLNDFFVYDNTNNRLELNKPEILTVKEFSDLLEYNRNKCPEDKTGKLCLRAFRELTYIYLAICWQSPFSGYLELDRHQEALDSARLTEEEFNDPTFRAACRKFKAILDENRSIKMLKAAQNTADKFIDYFNNLDPEERDVLNGHPIFKVKDLIAEISLLHKVHEELTILEQQVKKEMTETSSIRAGAKEGFLPDF